MQISALQSSKPHAHLRKTSVLSIIPSNSSIPGYAVYPAQSADRHCHAQGYFLLFILGLGESLGYISGTAIHMANLAPTARTREKPSGDEEATANLKLGEFQNVPTLTLSEARLLINAVMDHRKTLRTVDETE